MLGLRRPGGALARASLALEEAAGDLARGVRALFDVDCQREEVGAVTGLRTSHCGGEHHRVATANDDSAVRLLATRAREDLLARVERLLEAELARFTDLVTEASPGDGGAGPPGRPT